MLGLLLRLTLTAVMLVVSNGAATDDSRVIAVFELSGNVFTGFVVNNAGVVE